MWLSPLLEPALEQGGSHSSPPSQRCLYLQYAVGSTSNFELSVKKKIQILLTLSFALSSMAATSHMGLFKLSKKTSALHWHQVHFPCPAAMCDVEHWVISYHHRKFSWADWFVVVSLLLLDWGNLSLFLWLCICSESCVAQVAPALTVVLRC